MSYRIVISKLKKIDSKHFDSDFLEIYPAKEKKIIVDEFLENLIWENYVKSITVYEKSEEETEKVVYNCIPREKIRELSNEVDKKLEENLNEILTLKGNSIKDEYDKKIKKILELNKLIKIYLMEILNNENIEILIV